MFHGIDHWPCCGIGVRIGATAVGNPGASGIVDMGVTVVVVTVVAGCGPCGACCVEMCTCGVANLAGLSAVVAAGTTDALSVTRGVKGLLLTKPAGTTTCWDVSSAAEAMPMTCSLAWIGVTTPESVDPSATALKDDAMSLCVVFCPSVVLAGAKMSPRGDAITASAAASSSFAGVPGFLTGDCE